MYIIGAILAFSALVIIHELGHFTLARINGVKVEEFSLGMGPKIFGIKGKETDYIIKAFPIGGYVKMLGEESGSTDTRSFSNKSAKQKLSIIAAGPIMNLVFAIVIFSIIASFKGYVIPVISKVEEGKPAITAGIKEGDKILKVNNTKISNWEDFQTIVYTTKGAPLAIDIVRNGEIKTVNVTPAKIEEENRYIIGVYPTAKMPNLGEAIGHGFSQTGSLIKQTGSFFKTLFAGKASASDFGGPITIIKVSGEAAKAGTWSLLSFAAFLSVQLAIFNIIPFPALDGGWIFMLLLEIITGKKLDDSKVGVINTIGFAILMTLMVLVTVKDILYPIKF